jgi:hypothetical protein
MNNSRKEAILSLKRRLEGAITLIICDLYILSPRGDGDEYKNELYEILPSTLKFLSLVCPSNKVNHEFLDMVRFELPAVNIRYFDFKTIHDRVWIINENNAFTTGTSFNSIGSKLSFISELNDEDFEAFLNHLRLGLLEVLQFN